MRRARGLLKIALVSGGLAGGAEASEGRDVPAAVPVRAELGRADEAGDDVDTEHLFGFTEGSDIGAPGEVEVESETTGRSGKRGGRFRAVDSALTLKVPLTDRVRIAPGFTMAAYDIRGVPELADRRAGVLDGASLEMRVRLVERSSNPFGLTLGVMPGFGGADGGTGLPARTFGAKTSLFLDRELIAGRLVAAVNASLELGSTRPGGLGTGSRASAAELSGAIAARVAPTAFLGVEARYARAYDGLGLDRFAGQAVYLGPTAYVSLPAGLWASVAWSVQVAGGEAGAGQIRDLTAFDRHQVRLRVGGHF